MNRCRVDYCVMALAFTPFISAGASASIVFRDDFNGLDSGVGEGSVAIISPTGWAGTQPPRTNPFDGDGNIYVSNKCAGWALGGEPNATRETVILQTFGSTHTAITSGAFVTSGGAGTIDFARGGRDFLGGSGEGTIEVFLDTVLVHSEFLAYGDNTYRWNTVSAAANFAAGSHTITFRWSGQAPYAGREDSSVAIDWVQVNAPIPAPAAAPLLALAGLIVRGRRRR